MAEADNAAPSIVELICEISHTHYNTGSCHKVEVTHINKPDDFYVRPTSYYSYLSELEAYEGPLEDSKLIPGRVVVYESHIGKRFVRGQIQNIVNDGLRKICSVLAIDYGFIECAYDNCLKIPKHRALPGLSVRCRLGMCKPTGNEFDQKAIKTMKFFVGNEPAEIIITGQTADKLVVQLKNSCPDDISTMMAYCEVSCLGYGRKAICLFSYHARLLTLSQPKFFFTYKNFQVGDTVHVQVLSGDSLQNFYVADTKEYKDYTAESVDMFRFLNVQTDIKPKDLKVGECVAVYDGCSAYDRGVVKEKLMVRREAKVQLVDSGEIVLVNVLGTRVKALNRESFFLRPALAIYCSTDDTQAWDNGLGRFLSPGFEFIITVKQLGKNLDSPNIVTLAKIK